MYQWLPEEISTEYKEAFEGDRNVCYLDCGGFTYYTPTYQYTVQFSVLLICFIKTVHIKHFIINLPSRRQVLEGGSWTSKIPAALGPSPRWCLPGSGSLPVASGSVPRALQESCPWGCKRPTLVLRGCQLSRRLLFYDFSLKWGQRWSSRGSFHGGKASRVLQSLPLSLDPRPADLVHLSGPLLVLLDQLHFQRRGCSMTVLGARAARTWGAGCRAHGKLSAVPSAPGPRVSSAQALP